MQKWKEIGYVPDSEEEDELRSSQSHRSFHPTAIQHAVLPSLENGKLDTTGEHEDGHPELPKISKEKTEDESCNAQNTLVHSLIAMTVSGLTRLIDGEPTS
jgi:hypothetical protein